MRGRRYRERPDRFVRKSISGYGCTRDDDPGHRTFVRDVLALQLLKLGSDISAEEIDLLPFIDVVDPLNHQRFRSGHRVMHRCFIMNPCDAQQAAEALAGGLHVT